MNTLKNTLTANHLLLIYSTEITLNQSSSSSKIRSYSQNHSPQTINNRKKKFGPSFRPGPFKGALLNQTTDPETTKTQVPSPSPPQNQNQNQIQNPIKVHHKYSPSQLVKSLKPNSNLNSKLHFPHSDLIKNHLEDLLFPLTFSDQVACRIVSSKNLIKSQSSLDALKHVNPFGFALLGEHNSKFSFIGRRMMHFALSNFLLHAPRIQVQNNNSIKEKMTSEVIEEALLTKFVLGQYVGHQWELEKIMRWRELSPLPSDTLDSSELKPKIPLSTGLWTARGHAVEAIIGAVMTQYGTRLSNAVFNSLVLPHLSFRLDRSYVPAIKAIQAHDKDLENPKSGLVDWNHLDILPFTEDENHVLLSSDASHRSSIPVAAVG